MDLPVHKQTELLVASSSGSDGGGSAQRGQVRY